MRIYRVIAFFLIPAAAGLLAGCQTPSSQRFAEHTDQQFALSREDAVLAEALASFGMGVLNEGMLHPGNALANYSQAVQLEPDRNELYIRIASQHIKLGEHDKAIAVMQKACRRMPKSIDACLYLAQIYQGLKQFDKAEELCRKAISIDPQNYKGYIQLASTYLEKKSEDPVFEILNNALDNVDEKLPILRLLGDLHAQKINISAGEKAVSELKQAICYYKQASEQPRDDLTLSYLYRLGDLYILNRNFEQALECFSAIAIQRPDDKQVQKKLALCYIGVCDKENALRALKSIIGHEAENAELQYNFAELYEAIGDITNAISCFTTACDMTPPNRMPYLKLALLYLKTNPEKAHQPLEAGLMRLPDDLKLLEVLANVYLREGRYKKAVSIFDRLEKIIAKQDSSLLTAGFFLTCGVAARQADMPEKARSFYQKSLARDPSMLEAYIQLASLYVKQNRKKDAIQLMEKAVQVLPDDPNSYYYLALIDNSAQNFEAAVSAFKKAEELVSKSSSMGLTSTFYFNYAAACERSGQFEQAEELLQKSILLDAENANAFNYLAYMWAEKGVNLEKALDYVSHALDLEPDNGAFIDTLGWIYFKQKKYQQALDQIQSAFYFIPDDPTITEHLGDILATLNNEQDAIFWWKHSYLINPANKALEDKMRKHGVNIDELKQETVNRKIHENETLNEN